VPEKQEYKHTEGGEKGWKLKPGETEERKYTQEGRLYKIK